MVPRMVERHPFEPALRDRMAANLERFQRRPEPRGDRRAAAVAAVRGGGVSEGKLIAYTTSYEKNPDSNFVGYAGVVF